MMMIIKPRVMSTTTTTATTLYDVVIVGGGASGIYANYQLLKTHKVGKTLVLEGRDRLGGRTQTTATGIDMGAQWIGPKHSTLLCLVEHFNLKLVEQTYYPPSTNSIRLTECVGFKNPTLTDEAVMEITSFINMLSRLCEEIDVFEPNNHPMAKKWDHMSFADYVAESNNVTLPAARMELLLFAQTVLACNPAKISFLFFLFYVKSSGGMESLGDGELGAQKWKVEGGIQQISELMVRECKMDVRYNAHVVEICGEGGCNNNNNKRITTKNGQVFQAKKVIVAISPQLICKLLVRFEPPLPRGKINLCNALQPGHAIKVIITYAEEFWLTEKINKTTPNVHFTSLGPVHNLFHGKHGPHPCLVGLITGDVTYTLEEKSENERRQIVLNQLFQMYGTEKALAPISYLEKVWSSELFSGGCYAGVLPPNGSFWENSQHFRTPIDDIHWASTETATHFYGYVEGALLAGDRVAREIANTM